MLNSICDRSYRDIIWWTPFDASIFRILHLCLSCTLSLLFFLSRSFRVAQLLLRRKLYHFMYRRCTMCVCVWFMVHVALYSRINKRSNESTHRTPFKRIISPAKCLCSEKIECFNQLNYISNDDNTRTKKSIRFWVNLRRRYILLRSLFFPLLLLLPSSPEILAKLIAY